MSEGIEFEEDNFGRPSTGAHIGAYGGSPGLSAQGFSIPSNTPKMTAWLMKKGIAKSEKSATGVLLIVVAINIIITFIIFKLFI